MTTPTPDAAILTGRALECIGLTKSYGGVPVTAMIGRKIDDLFPRRIPVGSGEPLLQVRELTMRDAPEPVSLNVRPGEVVGLAGLVGAGRTELLEAIYGVRAAHGEVLVGGTRVRRGVPDAAIRHGMAMVPEERKSAGLLMQLSIEDNTGLPHLGDFTRFGVVNPKALHNAVAEAVQRVRLRFRDVSQPVATLSGGNQQKVVLARWLLGGMRILLLDEPTRGVDVGARAELYRIITGLAETGVAVLLASSDMDEVVNLSHRVLVLRDRRVAGVVDPTATDDAQVKERILRLAMGLTESDQLLTTGSKGSRPHPPSHEHGEHRP